jgi:isopentenyldiphosphate isomerase
MREAQDLGELFDLYTREGAPLGVRKPRGEVHRDGDWHRSIHIWIWTVVNGEPHVIFQRRSAAKDTWPDALDAAVTGHARAGEPLAATLREAEEEIGLHVQREDLAHLGLRRKSDTSRPGVIDNELQDIFARRAPVEMRSLTPDPVELGGLVAIPLGECAKVLCQGGDALGVQLEGGEIVEARIRGSEVVPAGDGYYAKAVASLVDVVGGRDPGEWEIG